MVKYINKDGKCLAIVSLSTAGKRLPEPIHKNVVLMVCYKRLLTNTASYVIRYRDISTMNESTILYFLLLIYVNIFF